MQAQATIVAVPAVEHLRLGELEQELGIAGFQKPIWHDFVETFESLSASLAVAETDDASSPIEVAPSLSAMLRAHQRRLAIERQCTCELIEITDLLYRSLTPRQRGHADRLLRPLCTKLGFGAASARQSQP